MKIEEATKGVKARLAERNWMLAIVALLYAIIVIAPRYADLFG